METNYVHTVYNKIASHFDKTRSAHWTCVKKYYDSLDRNLLIGDIGCGNGKNMKYRDDLIYIGHDICPNLIDLASTKNINGDLNISSGLSIPHRDCIFDGMISIAVIHHLSSEKDRIMFISELIRCTVPGGKILFTVWALEQPMKNKWISLDTKGDYFVPWKDKESGQVFNRYYHFFSKDEIINLVKNFEDTVIISDIDFESYNYCVTLIKK